MASAQDSGPEADHTADRLHSAQDMDAAAHLPDTFLEGLAADIHDHMVDSRAAVVAEMAHRAVGADMVAGNIAAVKVADNCRPSYLDL